MKKLIRTTYRGYKNGRLVFDLDSIPSKKNYSFDTVYEIKMYIENGKPKYSKRKVK